MFIYCICTQYLVGAPFALITASIRRGMEVISFGTAEVVWKPRFLDSGLQLICIVGSGVSHLPLDNTHRLSMGFRSASLLANQAQ